MRWRMQEYISRLAHTYRLDLESVVVYIGRGAGREDAGVYQVNGLTGQTTLTWRYTVVRLWELPAETLLAVGQPAILALVGQTHMAQPEVVLPEVVRRLRQVPDVEQRGWLLTTLLALLEDEEVITMVERLLTDDDVRLDLPYLQRLRAQGRKKGGKKGAVRKPLTSC
jgi:predicted transposase YdaD